MIFKATKLPGAYAIDFEPSVDERGSFRRTFCADQFEKHGLNPVVRQCSVSHNRCKGTLRGLHYQLAFPQGKLARIIAGEVFDVAVDLRQGSASFGKWVGEILSDSNHKSLYVPQGFAHGFCVLSDEADVIYKVNNEYSPENDRGILWSDPEVGVSWPIDNPIISEKDTKQPLLKNADNDFVLK